ncbi:MAG: hypothetical protein WCX20_01665 [Candidatus Shapirobacteria bacterium]|jgi:hypothetical protein
MGNNNLEKWVIIYNLEGPKILKIFGDENLIITQEQALIYRDNVESQHGRIIRISLEKNIGKSNETRYELHNYGWEKLY